PSKGSGGNHFVQTCILLVNYKTKYEFKNCLKIMEGVDVEPKWIQLTKLVSNESSVLLVKRKHLIDTTESFQISHSIKLIIIEGMFCGKNYSNGSLGQLS
ncbi:hypothetical protein, partial [Mesobacillus subterraneus]